MEGERREGGRGEGGRREGERREREEWKREEYMGKYKRRRGTCSKKQGTEAGDRDEKDKKWRGDKELPIAHVLACTIHLLVHV